MAGLNSAINPWHPGVVDTDAELRARRLIAQGLAESAAGPVLDSPQAAASWMLATQGQLYASGIEALAIRSHTPTEQVLAAVRHGDIVRTWSQRGTHHFLARKDAGWMMLLCNPRIEAAAAKRRPGLGLTPENVQTARQVLHQAAATEAVPRTVAYQLFADVGIDPGEGRGPHLLRSLGGEGALVQGPRRGNEDTFVLLKENPGSEPSEDEALKVLAERYFTARGPAGIKDLAWWSGLTMTQARRGLALAEELVEWQGYWMGAFQEKVSSRELALALKTTHRLPAFDEYLLGYQNRSQVCAAEHIPTVGPTKNGMCRPFTLVSGVVTGVTDQGAGRL